MDDWIDGVTEYNENFRSFILAGHLEHENFDVDVVMQVMCSKLSYLTQNNFFVRFLYFWIFLL